jgi:hypothetical protein
MRESNWTPSIVPRDDDDQKRLSRDGRFCWQRPGTTGISWDLNRSFALTTAKLLRKPASCHQMTRRQDRAYKRIASRMEDRAMLDGIKELIAGLQAEKAALHSEQTK